MPTFQTPEPITAVVEVVAGSVRLVATDRDDTVVEIRPRDPSRASDVRIAEQARTDFRNGTLVVSAGRRFISLGRAERSTSTSSYPRIPGCRHQRPPPRFTPPASTPSAKWHRPAAT